MVFERFFSRRKEKIIQKPVEEPKKIHKVNKKPKKLKKAPKAKKIVRPAKPKVIKRVPKVVKKARPKAPKRPIKAAPKVVKKAIKPVKKAIKPVRKASKPRPVPKVPKKQAIMETSKPAIPAAPIQPKETTKSVVIKPVELGSDASMKEVGRVSHYFDKLNVAVIKLSATLRQGDHILIKGSTTNIKQRAGSMEVNHMPISVAREGEMVGLLVAGKVRSGDRVFRYY